MLDKNNKKQNIIVIIGGTGMLGQALLTEANARPNFTPKSIARKNADYNIDVTNTNQLFECLDKINPRYIINTVAQINLQVCEKDPSQAHQINAKVNKDLASYCADKDIKLCYISTDHYYSGDKDNLHCENNKITLLNTYAKTKYEGEIFTLNCPNALVIRTNIIGFRGWKGQPTFIEWLFDALFHNKDITMFNDFYTSSIDVKSCAQAILNLVSMDANGILNVASRQCVSKQDFILALCARLDLNNENLHSGSVTTLSGVKRANSLGLDVSCAEKILGYNLPDLNAVIDNILNAYKTKD